MAQRGGDSATLREPAARVVRLVALELLEKERHRGSKAQIVHTRDDHDATHAARIAAKNLRYLLAALPVSLRGTPRIIKDLRRLLGDANAAFFARLNRLAERYLSASTKR